MDSKSSSDLIVLELLRLVQDLEVRVAAGQEECKQYMTLLTGLEQKIEAFEAIIVRMSRPWYKKLLGID